MRTNSDTTGVRVPRSTATRNNPKANALQACDASSLRLTSAGSNQREKSPRRACRNLLPQSLGLADGRNLALPASMEECHSGEECCWRWLAHTMLKEASWLREDLDGVQHERESCRAARARAGDDQRAFSELKDTHSQIRQQILGLRADAADLRGQVHTLRMTITRQTMVEKELVTELADLDEGCRKLEQDESAHIRCASDAHQELNTLRKSADDKIWHLAQLEEANLSSRGDASKVQKACDRLRREAAERAIRDAQQQKKNNRTRSR